MPNVYTTLTEIRAHTPCEDGWKKLLKHLGKTKADNEPLPLSVILDSNGLTDAMWCLRALPDAYHALIVSFACDCAESVLPLFEQQFPDDARPRNAIAIARQGVADADADAARAAARAAWAAAGAAWAAAGAAWAAAGAARAAAGAAWAAAGAAWAAAWAAAEAAGAAAVAAEAKKQLVFFRKYFCTEEAHA